MYQSDFIDVGLRASPRLAFVLAVSHAAAMAAIAVLPVFWWLRLAACVLVLTCATVLIYRRALLKGAHAVVRLRLMRDGSCQLQMANGRVVDGQLCRGWFVSPQLIVMRIACTNERYSRGIALLADGADADDLRRLRIFLHFAIDLSGRLE